MGPVSKHGLRSCPACGQHVRVREVSACPFCDAALAAPSAARAFPGRGGLIAAGLLSLGLAGCGGSATRPDPAKVKPAQPQSTVAPAPPDVALYGMPPQPDGVAPPTAADDDPATSQPLKKKKVPPEAQIVPLYGVAPAPSADE